MWDFPILNHSQPTGVDVWQIQCRLTLTAHTQWEQMPLRPQSHKTVPDLSLHWPLQPVFSHQTCQLTMTPCSRGKPTAHGNRGNVYLLNYHFISQEISEAQPDGYVVPRNTDLTFLQKFNHPEALQPVRRNLWPDPEALYILSLGWRQRFHHLGSLIELLATG